MSTEERHLSEFPQIDHEIKLSQTEAQEGHSCVAVSDSSHRRNHENTLFRLSSLTRVCCSKVKSKFKNNRCCLWSSKAVILILVWNLIISVCFKSFFDPSLYTVTMFKIYDDTTEYATLMFFGLSYGISALLLVFYPLAGFLADVRWGRYATVKNSLCFLFWDMVIVIILGGLVVLGSIPLIVYDSYTTIGIIVLIFFCIVFGAPLFLGIMFLLCSTTAFSANVIQFGIDQLHDAPANTLTLYIHWYAWTSQVGLFLIRLPGAFGSIYTYLIYICSPLLIVLAFFFLAVSLCLEKYKRHWFLIEPGNTNPYRLVYKVVKFAKDHTSPIHRSAFTYCEDELPSRLDLGKEKYGGPFTTEEVEKVKAFLGILRVLLMVGPIFFVEVAFSENLPGLVKVPYYYYLDLLNDVPFHAYFYGSGCLTPLLILVLIPLYLCLLRPFIHDYIPGMLKRMGLGMVLLLISGLCTLMMGVVRNNCVPTKYYCELSTYLVGVNPNFLIIQFIFNALSYLLLYVSAFEFICAQSPHSMKGLLIGTFFAINSLP